LREMRGFNIMYFCCNDMTFSPIRFCALLYVRCNSVAAKGPRHVLVLSSSRALHSSYFIVDMLIPPNHTKERSLLSLEKLLIDSCLLPRFCAKIRYESSHTIKSGYKDRTMALVCTLRYFARIHCMCRMNMSKPCVPLLLIPHMHEQLARDT
jgi:hypothetical protein